MEVSQRGQNRIYSDHFLKVNVLWQVKSEAKMEDKISIIFSQVKGNVKVALITPETL